MAASIETPRLILRSWHAEDLEPFFRMSQDTEVMRYFPDLLSRTESDQLAQRIQHFIDLQGWGFWAIELKESGEFIGFTGLHHQPDQFEFSPCTEIGWRLKRSAWHKGYAFEAALASLDFGFNRLKLQQIFAFTTVKNLPSERLMQHLGMLKQGYFQHPKLERTHQLSQHVCYAITDEQFFKQTSSN